MANVWNSFRVQSLDKYQNEHDRTCRVADSTLFDPCRKTSLAPRAMLAIWPTARFRPAAFVGKPKRLDLLSTNSLFDCDNGVTLRENTTQHVIRTACGVAMSDLESGAMFTANKTLHTMLACLVGSPFTLCPGGVRCVPCMHHPGKQSHSSLTLPRHGLRQFLDSKLIGDC